MYIFLYIQKKKKSDALILTETPPPKPTEQTNLTNSANVGNRSHWGRTEGGGICFIPFFFL